MEQVKRAVTLEVMAAVIKVSTPKGEDLPNYRVSLPSRSEDENYEN